MKLIFSRFGGKYKKSKEIIKHFDNHKIYVESFLGSGAIFLQKPSVDKSILNDLDPLVYNIFLKVQKLCLNNETFNNDDYDWKPDKNLWNKLRDDIKKGDDDLYKSLYVVHHSFNGIGNSFSPSRHKNYKYNKDLSIYSDVLKNVIIKQNDYKDIIKQYDSEDTLFYLDPPYDIALQKNYYEYQSGINFIEMVDILKNIKGKFVLSLDITPITTQLFKDFNCIEIDFNYNTRKKNKIVKEYIIKNY